jgi:hypothetical protein
MDKDYRRAAPFLAVVFAAVIFSGCIQSSQEIVIDEEGMALVNFSAVADRSQAGSQLTQLSWQVEQLIPELNTNYYSSSRTFEEDYTEYIVYEWTARETVPVTDIRGATWKVENGSYEFGLSLDRIFNPEEIVSSEKNEVVMTITLKMPADIIIANTPLRRWRYGQVDDYKRAPLSEQYDPYSEDRMRIHEPKSAGAMAPGR